MAHSVARIVLAPEDAWDCTRGLSLADYSRLRPATTVLRRPAVGRLGMEDRESNPTRDALMRILADLGSSNIDDYGEAFELLRDRLVGRDGEDDPELDARFRSAMGRM